MCGGGGDAVVALQCCLLKRIQSPTRFSGLYQVLLGFDITCIVQECKTTPLLCQIACDVIVNLHALLDFVASVG